MKKMADEQTPVGQSASQLVIDVETLALLKGRDREFLDRLFREVNPYLSRVCLANNIVHEDVSELMHQTWERFFSNLDKFEGRSQIRTFICGILFNKIREYRRMRQRFVYEEDTQNFMEDAFTEDGWWRTEPSDPYRIAEHKQTAELIRECFDDLTEQQRTAFMMKEVENENPAEVCDVLGVNVSHLRVLLFRAKDKLRKCLEGKVSLEPV